jgi:hypothetical protein
MDERRRRITTEATEEHRDEKERSRCPRIRCLMPSLVGESQVFA